MKSYAQRMFDYVTTHPLFNGDTVELNIMDKHKRAIWKLQARITERINYMLTGENPVFFLTFTYDDEHLPDSIHEYDTQQHIIEYFQAHKGVISYVANTDYGKENGRFHWHAVAESLDPFDAYAWEYGAINFKRIPRTSITKQLTRYLIKLKRHATKVVDPFMIAYPYHFKNNR
jgi:hypothetical protein